MYNQNQHEEPKVPMSKRIARWIGILSSLFVVGFIAYWAFNLGRRDATEVPVVAALEGETRTQPENDEARDEDYQGLEVNDVLEGEDPSTSADINLAPEPEDLSDVEPATTSESEGEAEQNASTAQTGDTISENTGNEPLVENDTLTLAAPPKRPELLYVPSNSVETSEQASTQNETESQEQTAQTAQADEPEQPAENAADIEAVLDDITETDAPPPSSGEDFGPRLPSGTPLIQLAANTKAEDTRRQWAQLQADNQDVLGDKELYIEKANVNGKTFYRLRVKGFANSDQTRAACATLMARNVQCLAVAVE